MSDMQTALEAMLKWFGKYPELVPNPDHSADVDAAIAQAHAALARSRDLQMAIINLPLGPTYEQYVDDHETRTTYQAGHRDARHQAAELVVAAS